LKKKVPLRDVKKSLKQRTKNDESKKHSPLIKVIDAITIRSDKLNKSQMQTKMLKYIDKKIYSNSNI